MAWDVLSGGAKMAWDILSGVTKTAWDVLSGVANRCGMFCPGWQKNGMGCFVPGCFVLHSILCHPAYDLPFCFVLIYLEYCYIPHVQKYRNIFFISGHRPLAGYGLPPPPGGIL